MDKNAQKRGPGLLRGAEPGAAAWETARRLLETQTQNLHMVRSLSCWCPPPPKSGQQGPARARARSGRTRVLGSPAERWTALAGTDTGQSSASRREEPDTRDTGWTSGTRAEREMPQDTRGQARGDVPRARASSGCRGKTCVVNIYRQGSEDFLANISNEPKNVRNVASYMQYLLLKSCDAMPDIWAFPRASGSCTFPLLYILETSKALGALPFRRRRPETGQAVWHGEDTEHARGRGAGPGGWFGRH